MSSRNGRFNCSRPCGRWLAIRTPNVFNIELQQLSAELDRLVIKVRRLGVGMNADIEPELLPPAVMTPKRLDDAWLIRIT